MNKKAKPFVKWAGGKSQLLDKIDSLIPEEYKKNGFNYIEPFVGGGAVLFHLLNEYSSIKKVVISDINSELINTYMMIKDKVDELINILEKWQAEYHSLSREEQKKYYYSKRYEFNSRQNDKVVQAALFIFLNKTCFNGLYRVNRKNEFNVPINSARKPLICDKDNLLAVNKALQSVLILNSDFEETLKFAEGYTLFYLDPPYRPVSKTSSFNSYTKSGFNDNEQKRLADFCIKLDKAGYKWVLSNSESSDGFFENLYRGFNIIRVPAKRMINSKADKRAEIMELLISN